MPRRPCLIDIGGLLDGAAAIARTMQSSDSFQSFGLFAAIAYLPNDSKSMWS